MMMLSLPLEAACAEAMVAQASTMASAGNTIVRKDKGRSWERRRLAGRLQACSLSARSAFAQCRTTTAGSARARIPVR